MRNFTETGRKPQLRIFVPDISLVSKPLSKQAQLSWNDLWQKYHNAMNLIAGAKPNRVGAKWRTAGSIVLIFIVIYLSHCLQNGATTMVFCLYFRGAVPVPLLPQEKFLTCLASMNWTTAMQRAPAAQIIVQFTVRLLDGLVASLRHIL